MAEAVDVAVAGSGPVACAFAASLAGSGLSVVRIGGESTAPDRPIALSHGSRLILERLGAWEHVGSTPIRTIYVSQRHAFGRTVMRASDHGLPALGYVAPYVDVLRSLVAKDAPALRGSLLDWREAEDRAQLRVRTGEGETELSARLLVLADGGYGAPADHLKNYGQALVAEVTTERPHQNAAWERFTSEGPLALLPYADRLFLVWSVQTGEASRLLRLGDAEFLEDLGRAFGGRLGAFVRAGSRSAFPLTLRYRAPSVAPHTIVIGNAAQTLHPVAGQGLNLGLRDAWELAEQLRDARTEEIGGEPFTQRYARRRRVDRGAGIAVTDSLVRLFSNDSFLLAGARGIGLAALDILPPARRFLARRMMFGARALP